MRNPKSEYTFNFQGCQKTKFIILSGYSSNKHWKEKFFFAQGNWEFLATEVIVDPKVPWEACRLSSSRQNEPILNKSEGVHVRELMEYAKGHIMEMEFNTIFSQSALAAHLKHPPTESTVIGGAPAGPKLKKKRKATALQILESQSPEVAKRKPPVHLLDKPSNGVEVEKSPEFLQGEFLNLSWNLLPQLHQKSRSGPPRFLRKKFLSILRSKLLPSNRSTIINVQGKKKEKTRWGTMCHQFWL